MVAVHCFYAEDFHPVGTPPSLVAGVVGVREIPVKGHVSRWLHPLVICVTFTAQKYNSFDDTFRKLYIDKSP